MPDAVTNMRVSMARTEERLSSLYHDMNTLAETAAGYAWQRRTPESSAVAEDLKGAADRLWSARSLLVRDYDSLPNVLPPTEQSPNGQPRDRSELGASAPVSSPSQMGILATWRSPITPASRLAGQSPASYPRPGPPLTRASRPIGHLGHRSAQQSVLLPLSSPQASPASHLREPVPQPSSADPTPGTARLAAGWLLIAGCGTARAGLSLRAGSGCHSGCHSGPEVP